MLERIKQTTTTWSGEDGGALEQDPRNQPHLRLVGSSSPAPASDDHEYAPLPFYAFDERPLTLAIDPDEAATALHLAGGLAKDAAKLLKTSPTRLRRVISSHPRLARIEREHLEILNDNAIAEVAHAFDSPEDRRREWATQRVLGSRLGRDNPLAPQPQQGQSASLAIEGSGKRFTFRWRTAADDVPPDEGPVIDHDDGPSAA